VRSSLFRLWRWKPDFEQKPENWAEIWGEYFLRKLEKNMLQKPSLDFTIFFSCVHLPAIFTQVHFHAGSEHSFWLTPPPTRGEEEGECVVDQIC